MNLNNYAITQILDAFTGNGSITWPTTLYLALLDEAAAASDTVADNAGKEIFTPGNNGYARQVVTLAAESGGVSLSDALITFGPAATLDWPEAVAGWLLDQSDNIWWQGALTVAKQADISDTVEIATGDLSLQLA